MYTYMYMYVCNVYIYIYVYVYVYIYIYIYIFLDLVRTLAAAFWTTCSLFIEDAGQPPSIALQ